MPGGAEGPFQPAHHSPNITRPEVVEKIVWLRKHYHFGPAKIAMYLARYHDVRISTSRVWRILKRLGMNRLPALQRYQRRALRWKRYVTEPRALSSASWEVSHSPSRSR